MSQSPARRSHTAQNIDRLSERHAKLDAEIEELDSRRHLTADEELHLAQLKKAKLQAKDELATLKLA